MSADNSSRELVVAVTGGARGIGQATARLLAASGARVVIADIDGDQAQAAATSIGARASSHQLDVSDRSAFEAFVDSVEAETGPLDALINNAGIADASPHTIEQSPAMIDRTIAVNLNGVINGTLAALRVMESRNRGQVVNIASLAGITGVRGLPIYSASKFGVVGFTESMRAEYEGTGISFTCVMPGPVATDMMVGTYEAPLIRLISPEAIAVAVVDSLESKRARIALPRSTGMLARLGSLLPPGLAIKLNRAIRMDRVYTEIDEQARAEYTARITSAAE